MDYTLKPFQQVKSAMNLPTTPEAKKIANLYNRKHTTPWSEKEIKAFKLLMKAKAFDSSDMALIERYYAYERRKGEKGIHRRDLCTFLNNYQPELDRAREWEHNHPAYRPKKKYVSGPIDVRTDEQVERDRVSMRTQLETWKKSFGE